MMQSLVHELIQGLKDITAGLFGSCWRVTISTGWCAVHEPVNCQWPAAAAAAAVGDGGGGPVGGFGVMGRAQGALLLPLLLPSVLLSSSFAQLLLELLPALPPQPAAAPAGHVLPLTACCASSAACCIKLGCICCLFTCWEFINCLLRLLLLLLPLVSQDLPVPLLCPSAT